MKRWGGAWLPSGDAAGPDQKPLATKTINRFTSPLDQERHMAGDHAASIATTFPNGTK
jgi:hypothetical protein